MTMRLHGPDPGGLDQPWLLRRANTAMGWCARIYRGDAGSGNLVTLDRNGVLIRGLIPDDRQDDVHIPLAENANTPGYVPPGF